VTEFAVPPVRVVTVNVAVRLPAATVTLAGTVALLVLPLESVTLPPPAGAGPFNVTVPVLVWPRRRLAGASVTE
jgi:hypothetical protein